MSSILKVNTIQAYTASDVEVDDALNVTGTLSVGDVNLAGSSGSSLVGFTQSGIGAISRTVQDKERDIVSVFDFMTTAQIADCRARTFGENVATVVGTAYAACPNLYFPPNCGYRFNTTVSIDDSGATWIGYGAEIRNASGGATTPTVEVTVNPGTVDYVKIKGFKFSSTADCGDHIRMSRCGQGTVEHCYGSGSAQALVAMTGDCYGMTVYQCHATDCEGGGFRIINAGGVSNNGNHITECTAINCNRGVDMQGNNSENHVTRGYYEGNDNEQIRIRGGRANRIDGVYVEQGTTRTPTDFIYLGSDGGTNTVSAVISRCVFAEVAVASSVVNVAAANDTIIRDNDYSGSRTFATVAAGSLRTRVGVNIAPSAATYLSDSGTGTIDERDNQMIRLYDDFTGDVLADQWNTRVGSDGQCVAFVKNAAVNPGGIIRGTGGDDVGGTMALNGSQIDSDLDWKASAGGLTFEVRLSLGTADTDICVFAGFTDQVAALEMPIQSAASADTLTTTATDAVGVMFDSAMATDKWWLVGVANNVAATANNSTLQPTAGTMETWRIEVSAAGSASFYRNGVFVHTMTGAVTASVALTPVVAVFSRGVATRSLDIDLISVRSMHY